MNKSILIHSYKITGISCNGCRTNIEETSNNIKDLIKATTNLEEGKSEVEMGTIF